MIDPDDVEVRNAFLDFRDEIGEINDEIKWEEWEREQRKLRRRLMGANFGFGLGKVGRRLWPW